MSPSRVEWASAYCEQARSDWQVYELLARTSGVIPRCHQLHYLQMATEKVAKAYRFRDTGTDIGHLTTQHVGIVKFINAYMRSPEMKTRYQDKTAQLRKLAQDYTKLAREIELLAPAVDRENSPRNAEYPWITPDGQLMLPCRFEYPTLSMLRAAGGRSFLKLIKTLIQDFNQRSMK